MIKTLRTCTVFILLNAVLAGWMVGWSGRDGQYSFRIVDRPDHHEYRPILHVLRVVLKDPYSSIIGCGISGEPSYIAQTPSGCLYLEQNPRLGKTKHDIKEPILAAGIPYTHQSWANFGLLSKVATRRTRETRIRPVENYALIETSLAVDAHNEHFRGRRPPAYTSEPTHSWEFFWMAGLHDFILLLTLIAFAISLTGIPRWPLWKRLTPAQRRRLKNACTHCGYTLEGLCSPTCPECGNTLPPSPSQGEGRGEGASEASL